MNETQALNDLHSLLNKYERMKHSRRHELETDIQLFESWINSGHQGVFPLDLDKWGITGDLVETTPKTGSALRQPGSLPFIPGQERPDSGSSLMEPQNLPTQTDHSAGLEHRDAMIADPESEATARLWLDEARKDISDGADIEHLKEAVQLCDEVLSSPAEDMHSEAGQVRAQALTSLGRLVDKELEEGQLAQKRGDEKAARAAYQRALLIESENESAKNALLSLDQADIDLPDELKQLLPDARKYFDKVREMDGIVISQIRGGNLSESKKAVDYFQNLMISERKDYFDPMTGRLAPLTPDVLLEANKIWLQRSEELVQDILQKIKPYLPGKPRTAKGILENGHLEKDETGKLVRRPYHVQSERLLENKELEVDEQLSRLIDAESLVAQAEASNDPIDVFKQLQKARDVFEYMEGIGARIENARQTALQHLMARIEETYASARTALKLLKFDEARAKVGEADQMGAHWASQPVPTDLTEKLHTSQALRESIDALEKDRNDFEKIVAEIRKLKEDELKHPEAFRLLDSLAAEERFQVFSGEFHRINHDMDSLRGIADQLSTARLARSLADWQRVWNIASENKSHAGLDRDLREQFEKLFLEADMELRVIEAREFIEKGDIPKANNILSRLVHSSHPFHQEVSQRLAAEIAHIKEVIQQNPPWNTLFETALAEARKPGFEQQFAALHMLRYISGDI
ncbi:MAG: hypothetical protein NT121_23215, partial [Chloroflexi bacterium]|nr:hypothetical protein [Chloroflexota bacterium]